MQNVTGSHYLDNPPAEELLQSARSLFLLASQAVARAEIERYAALGRDYLKLAHAAARIDDNVPELMWNPS